MHKPRILFVTRHHALRSTGGTEEQGLLLSTELARRGWDVHYASEMNDVPVPNVVDGVTLHGLPENPSVWRGNRALLCRLMRELQPDVIYNRMYNLYTGHALLDAPAGTIRVWASAAEKDGLLWKKLWALGQNMNPIRRLYKLPLWHHICSTARDGVRRTDLALVQRTEQIAELRRAGIAAELIRNAQPVPPASQMQSHRGHPQVLWAASVKAWKRPEQFIELAARCRDLAADFVMVGAIQEPKYKTVINRAAANLPNFRYAGFAELSEIGTYFAQAHLFVNTSVNNEGYPNSFIHAWLHGVPVVTLGVDPDLLLSQGGLGVAAKSPDELAQAVRSLLTNPDRRREIGARARAFAEQEHDLGRVVDRLEKLLAEQGVKLPE